MLLLLRIVLLIHLLIHLTHTLQVAEGGLLSTSLLNHTRLIVLLINLSKLGCLWEWSDRLYLWRHLGFLFHEPRVLRHKRSCFYWLTFFSHVWLFHQFWKIEAGRVVMSLISITNSLLNLRFNTLKQKILHFVCL